MNQKEIDFLISRQKKCFWELAISGLLLMIIFPTIIYGLVSMMVR